MKYICPICNCNVTTQINTYKHYWITCNECGTVARERKDHYPLDIWLFRSVIQKTKLRLLYGKTLLPIKEVIDAEKKFDDYYSETMKRMSYYSR